MNFFVVIILEKDSCALKSLSAYWKPLFEFFSTRHIFRNMNV